MKNPQAVTKKAILLNKSEQETLKLFIEAKLEELDEFDQDIMPESVWEELILLLRNDLASIYNQL